MDEPLKTVVHNKTDGVIYLRNIKVKVPASNVSLQHSVPC